MNCTNKTNKIGKINTNNTSCINKINSTCKTESELVYIHKIMDIQVYKTLLNKCILENPNFLIATFDITLINKSTEKITDISLIDAIISLKFLCNDIKFDVTSSSQNLTPLTSKEIMGFDGELLNVKKSYLPPQSASRLILRVTVRQELITEGCVHDCTLNIYNNSVILSGKINNQIIKPIHLYSTV